MSRRSPHDARAFTLPHLHTFAASMTLAVAVSTLSACGGAGTTTSSAALPGGSLPAPNASPTSGSSGGSSPVSPSPSSTATAAPTPPGSSLPQGEVATTSGIFTGTVSAGVDTFEGIPYAAPPVGALRWKPPQPVTPLKGVTSATAFKPACLQHPGSTETVAGPMNQADESEDCLYLNVFAPSDLAGKKPVDLWIYGGAYTAGYADPYDGTPYAKNGVVFVSFDYRVGIFGYFPHPGLDAENASHSSGNQGTLDQMAALQWVRKNIAAFGGDPNDITIHGESAGADSVETMLISPLTKGLFKRAIMESTSGLFPENTLASAESYFAANFPGYSENIATLRSLPAATVLAAQPAGYGIGAPMTLPYTPDSYGPIVDGYVLPAQERSLWFAHKFNTADILLGNCQNEGYLFTMPAYPQYETNPTFQSLVSSTYGPALSGDALADYPVSAPTDAVDQLGQLYADPFFNYGTREIARLESAVDANVYRYVFTRPAPGQTGPDTHICEIPFVFLGDYPVTAKQVVPDPNAAAYSAMIVDAWTRFMKTGNPNGGLVTNWPAYASNDPYVEFSASGPVPNSGYRNAQLDLVDEYLTLNNL